LIRRASLALALGLMLVPLAFSQEKPAGAVAESGNPETPWQWANFVILVAGLAYLIGKSAPAYFRGRTDEIQRALLQAQREIKDAEAKAADLELRLSGIKTEVDQLRSQARAEMASEAERVRTETERHLKRIQEQTSQEMTLMARAARDELRKYSAGLALDLAEQRIRARITPGIQEGFVDSFVQDLHRLRPELNAKEEAN
jgi:F0F1-type ATP synthase membrane subunit b/b'